MHLFHRSGRLMLLWLLMRQIVLSSFVTSSAVGQMDIAGHFDSLMLQETPHSHFADMTQAHMDAL
jgi:hypothetical protein